MSPHTRLRARFCPGKTCSVATFDQSHSSSSATSWARPVSVPCPISERAMRITTVSSGRITTQALTSGVPSAARTTVGPPNGTSNPRARPAPAAAVPTTKARRLSWGLWFMASSSSVRGGVNGFTHLLEGAAAADVGNGVVDVGVSRLGLLVEKSCDRHDHAALAIAALRNVIIDPGLLHPGRYAVDRESLDRGDLLADGFADLHATGSHRGAIDVNRAGAALGDAAAIFGAGQPDVFTDRPKQRRVRLDVDIDGLSVDAELCHGISLRVARSGAAMLIALNAISVAFTILINAIKFALLAGAIPSPAGACGANATVGSRHQPIDQTIGHGLAEGPVKQRAHVKRCQHMIQQLGEIRRILATLPGALQHQLHLLAPAFQRRAAP